jgi:RHH-type proline utilization regulon transcriptional repressor/proline dehydrogenase/delta 1-pyrroline-5-carboxylate dehydrogenase
VGRQPFGGWKASSVGGGAKAGGPNYVLQLCRVREGAGPADAAAGYEPAWHEHFSRAHEPVPLLGERNVLRYRPCRGVLVRAEAASAAGREALDRALRAARICGVPAAVSLAGGEAPEGVLALVEDEAALATRLAGIGCERLRALIPVSVPLRTAAHAAGIAVVDAPVSAAGRFELRHYLREQAVSRVVHRYGSVMYQEGGAA